MEVLFFWIAAIVVAGLIGQSKGRTTAGYLLGIFLGWIGVIIILCLPKTLAKQAEDLVALNMTINTPAAGSSNPGWYPDPYKTHRLRYYDGKAWTSHTSL